MADETNVNPDGLATKAFLITFLSTILYFGTVYVFILNGSLDTTEAAVESDDPEALHD